MRSLSGKTGGLRHPLPALLIGVILFGVLVRFYRLTTARLWTDEIFSAAMAKENLISIVGLTLRHDAHPPLYYIFLHPWQLISDSDTFLLLNSTVLSLVLGWTIFWTVRQLHSPATALVATAIYAVLPLEVVFAETLRMYELEGVLAVLMFYFVERFVRGEGSDRRNLLVMVVIGNVINLLHGFGAMVSLFIVLYGLSRSLAEKLAMRRVRTFAIAAVASGVTALYAVVVGSMRQTIGLTSATFSAISSELTIALLGHGIPYPSVAGLLLVGPFVALCLFNRRSGAITWWLFVAPTLLMIFISVLIKPVYTFRGTGLFMPFLAVALALLLTPRLTSEAEGASLKPLGVATAAVPFAVLIAATLWNAISYTKASFAGPATYWAQASRRGDTLYVDSFPSDYLGFVRYLPGQARPAMHDVMPPPPAHWRPILRRMGPRIVKTLRLLPDGNVLPYHERTVVPWFDKAVAIQQSRFWILRSTSGDCGVGGFTAKPGYTAADFTVLLCERAEAARS